MDIIKKFGDMVGESSIRTRKKHENFFSLATGFRKNVCSFFLTGSFRLRDSM